MRIRKVINEPIDVERDGVNIAGGVNAVVAANVNEPGSTTSVSSRQRIVQRSKRSSGRKRKETSDGS